MDPSKQSAANYASRPSTSAADLAAYIDAMCLGDPSSSQRQQQLQLKYAAPTSPLMRPPPPQGLRPTTPSDVHPLMHQLRKARHYWPQPQRYGGDEASSRGGYVSPFGAAAYSPAPSSAYVSPFGVYSPRPTAPASSRPSVAPQLCTLSASANQYQPIAASRPSVAPSPSMASSSASQYQPPASHYQPGATFSAHDYHESSLLSALRATQAGTSCWRRPPPTRQGRTLEEIRSDLHRGPMELALVMFTESSAHVVRLLEEGGEEMRLSVLAGVKRYVHRVMDNREGHVVFLALLRACEGRFDELQGIVEAAIVPNGRFSLMRSAKQEYGETALKVLITAVAQYPKLCEMLTDCLVRERLMDHSKGEQLLHHCFTMMRYEDTSILIRYAIADIQSMLTSAFGSRCLAKCFMNARDEELYALEEVLLSHASQIARGQYSNYFVQRVLECGSEELKQGVVERLMEDVVSLSHHQFGSYVVEACFLRTRSLTLLLRVLSAFLGLRDDQLAELVQCCYGNYIVHKLLESGKDHFPDQTLALARRIEKLPAAVLDEMHARQVMRVVKRLFPWQRLY